MRVGVACCLLGAFLVAESTGAAAPRSVECQCAWFLKPEYDDGMHFVRETWDGCVDSSSDAAALLESSLREQGSMAKKASISCKSCDTSPNDYCSHYGMGEFVKAMANPYRE